MGSSGDSALSVCEFTHLEVNTPVTTFTPEDEAAMVKALEQAELALEKGEIPIGCVFVNHLNEVVAVGHNETNETRNVSEC
jgi:tRNA(Arg) A34 adenosine deaminase TadA